MCECIKGTGSPLYAMLGWLLYRNLRIIVGVVIFVTELLFCSISSYHEQLKQLSYFSLSSSSPIDLFNHHYKSFKALFCSCAMWYILDSGCGLVAYMGLNFTLYYMSILSRVQYIMYSTWCCTGYIDVLTNTYEKYLDNYKV